MIPLPGLGTLRALGIGLMFAGVTTITGSIVYYFKGKTAGRAEVQAVFDQAKAEANKAALEASEAYRRLEQEAAAKLKGAQDALAKERTNASRIAADLRTERERAAGLRDQIAGFAAGSGPAEQDTAAAARDRASTLGRLLDESLQLQEELAGDAEALAGSVRAMRAAWPD